MSEIRRLVSLPGYDDTSRDVYETAESTDGDSSTPTLTQGSPRSPSETSDTSDDDEDGDDESHGGVSRRRLYPARARTRFGAVQTGGNVDLSDRVDGRRRGYKVRRVAGKEDEDEGLEARIARLRREIEECKVEAESELDFGGRDEAAGSELKGLGRVLAGIEVSGQRKQRQTARTDGGAQKPETPESWPDAGGEATDEQLLGRVAGFDARLAALEQALGISSLDSATTEALTTPVLPSLTLLDRQMAALTAASSLTHLETASAKIQKLRGEAEQLAHFQSRPTTSGSGANEDEDDTASATLTQEDTTKLQSLYQILPNLQSLSPTVPALLARLRSLTTLHSSAATASSELDDIEKRQQEMDAELKAWREGLEKVEAAVTQSGETNGRNGKIVKQWVDDLETRLKAL